MFKKAPLAPRRDGSPAVTATVKCPISVDKGIDTRSGLAKVVEPVLLLAVTSIAVAAILAPLEKGVIDLIKRVGQLLAPGAQAVRAAARPTRP